MPHHRPIDSPAAAPAKPSRPSPPSLSGRNSSTIPDSPDIATSKQELVRWKKLAADGAEKINGAWIGGEERRKILDEAQDLTRQAVDMLEKNETLQAIDKLQESVRIYPNSFLTNFALGNVSMAQKNYDQAAQYFVMATRLKPSLPRRSITWPSPTSSENDLKSRSTDSSARPKLKTARTWPKIW